MLRLFMLKALAMLGLMTDAHAGKLFPEVSQYVEQRVAEFDEIPESRKAELEHVSVYIRNCLAAGRTAELTFICTHNSRRSQLGQLWAQVAAVHFAVPDVKTYSGGTEVTALNPRAVAALQRCGLEITSQKEESDNPRYQVRFQHGAAGELCFSKLFAAPPNPTSQFCAVLVCSQADQACPTASGCDLRAAIAYDDPKDADGTPLEEEAYDQRSRQISREMLYMMWRAAN